MFVYSMKASTLKFFAILGVALIAIATLMFLVPTYTVATTASVAKEIESIRFDGVKTSEDRISFLEQYGWRVEATPVEEAEVTVPKEFDKVMTTYNEIQKQQGLDLSKYGRRTMMRYTYKVTNYPDYSGTVYANILVYKNRVVAGDICSSDANGFIHTLSMPKVEPREQ